MNVQERGATHTAIRVGGDQNIGFVEGNHPLPHVAAISAAQLSQATGSVWISPNYGFG
jgi:hypothetical protein